MDGMNIVLLALAGGGCVLALAMGLRNLLVPTRTAGDRIAELTGMDRAPALSPHASLDTVGSRLGRIAAPASEGEKSLLRQRLIHGGFRSRNNLERFLVLRTLSAIIPPLLGLAFFSTESMPGTMLMVLVLSAGGYYLPAQILSGSIRHRQNALLRPFPDALDLLVCCVESGLGLDAAFRRVAEEMEIAAPLLSSELQQVNHEIAAGVPRPDALRHLDRRNGLTEMSALVGVLVQADRFGSSVAKSLRIHAELVRKKRMLAAEERAAKLSPKLTVVMVLFILPSLLLVLVGPAIVNITRNLWPTLTGLGG
jgi:tight adherence protein C